MTVWDVKIIPAVYDDAKETVYKCSVGDCIRYSMEVSDEYSSVYDWERVRIDTFLPANRQPYDIYRTSGKDYAQDSIRRAKRHVPKPRR